MIASARVGTGGRHDISCLICDSLWPFSYKLASALGFVFTCYLASPVPGWLDLSLLFYPKYVKFSQSFKSEPEPGISYEGL